MRNHFLKRPVPTLEEGDYAALHQAMKKLPERQFQIVLMRFWQQLTIDEIARRLKTSWKHADADISLALRLLYQTCSTDPRCTRTEYRASLASIRYQQP